MSLFDQPGVYVESPEELTPYETTLGFTPGRSCPTVSVLVRNASPSFCEIAKTCATVIALSCTVGLASPTVAASRRPTVVVPNAVDADIRHSNASQDVVSEMQQKDQEKQRFLEIAERLAQAEDPTEQARLKEILARLTFGE